MANDPTAAGNRRPPGPREEDVPLPFDRPGLERLAQALTATGAVEDPVALAESLRGRFVRFHQDRKTHPGYLVTQVTADGLIELQGFVGQFAPHLVERVDRPHSAAEGNC